MFQDLINEALFTLGLGSGLGVGLLIIHLVG